MCKKKRCIEKKTQLVFFLKKVLKPNLQKELFYFKVLQRPHLGLSTFFVVLGILQVKWPLFQVHFFSLEYNLDVGGIPMIYSYSYFR